MFRSLSVACTLVVLLVGGSVVVATPTASPPTIELSKAVHFLTPGGEDVVVGPGTFEVEATEQGLRLKPKDGKPEDAKVIQAQGIPSTEPMEASKTVSETLGEDSHRVALLRADGTGLEAVGSFSGVRTRGEDVKGNVWYGVGALANNISGSANMHLSCLDLTIGHQGPWPTDRSWSLLMIRTVRSWV
ncbi:MAG: hypothetical protein HZB35_09905 [Nitrospirae bacterium]|nr:hypothetical protein [Nitrospirota bacterium]